ncbi:MAG TPA: M1 family metallopeptidase [Kofleriaceae bacterium]
MPLRVVVGVIAVCCACRGDRPAEGPDPHSYAQPGRVAVRHLALDLTVDFERRALAGTATLALTRTDAKAPLMLDGDALVIDSVKECDGKPLAFRVGKRGKVGEPIRVDLGAGDCVAIAYHTSPDASALLWVEPSGTAGGKQPMLFTQSQSTHARSWIPLQDSPGVRFTYAATIRPPPGMWALMSAPNPQEPPADGVWKFEQPHPIPGYLMALAVGDFAFRRIGPRTGVYAEPSVVERAAWEFAEVETMIDAAEKLYGPYRWGRYDMLVLPPSFPFGGMENPNLSFLTPTVISGDRTLVSLIAHELAHSWSGNLVTNATWNDAWLNEGFTTYVEHRIMEQLRGRETSDVMWYLGRQDIDDTVAKHGRGPATRLAHQYGRDTAAEDIPVGIAYDKGALFLRTLELAYGRDTFDAWLRSWFDRHAFQSATSKMFEAEVKTLGTKVDIATWLYTGGVPADAAPAASAKAAAIEQLAASGADVDATSWTTMEWRIFLRALPDKTPAARLQALDDKYHLTATTNAEIAMHWLPRVVNADIRTAAPAVEAYLLDVGRVRNLRPLYAAMMAGGEFWRALAKTTFERAKPKYHPFARSVFANVVK